MERKFRVIKNFKLFYNKYITEESKEAIENSGFTLIDNRLVFKVGEIYTQYQLELAMEKIYKYMFCFQEISPAEEILRKMFYGKYPIIKLIDRINLITMKRDIGVLATPHNERRIDKDTFDFIKESMNKEKENDNA